MIPQKPRRIRAPQRVGFIALALSLVGCAAGGNAAVPTPTLSPTWTVAAVSSEPVTDTAPVTDTKVVSDSTSAEIEGVELTFEAEADTQVREFEPEVNFGAETPLRVDGGDDPTYQSYLRFTVEGVEGSVARATLRLYAETGADAGLSLYGSSSEWDEEAITWSSRPLPTLSPLLVLEEAVVAGQWLELDVTPLVGGNGSYSFVLGIDSSNGLAMTSREGIDGQRPHLLVTAVQP
jgi:hypothetical protein